MSELSFRAQNPASLWQNNPVTVQLLGLSPLLALSDSLVTGIAIGLASGIVLLLASLTVSSSFRLISTTWRFVYFLFILALYTSTIDLLLQWFYFPLYRELGIYVPLICCNFTILLHLELKASKHSPLPALRDACLTAIAYLLAIAMFSALREWLGTGQVLAAWHMLIPSGMIEEATITHNNTKWFGFMLQAPAALILLGLLLALRNYLSGMRSPSVNLEQAVTPALRARVTGKL